jgi:hypothetical protein
MRDCLDAALSSCLTIQTENKSDTVRSLSKKKLKRQLDRARSTDLIEGIQPAIGAAGPQAVRERLRRDAEQWTAQDIVRAAEIWMVEDVEELGSETKRYCFGDAKLPMQRNIRLPGSETAQDIASEIPLPSGRRCCKSGANENLAAGILLSVQFKRHTRIDVRAGIESDSRGRER